MRGLKHVLVGSALLVASIGGAQIIAQQGVSEEISSLAYRVDGPIFDADATERDGLRAFYDRRHQAPAWVAESGGPSADARDALRLLRAAAAEGLDPEEYGSPALDAHAAILDAGPRPTAALSAAFDVRLTVAMLRYLRHLHVGRVDPAALGVRLNASEERHDFAEVVQSAIDRHRIPETAAAMAPQLAQYRGLRDALAQYRALADAFPADPVTAARVGKIALGLERLRWLPDIDGERLVAINIPMFRLWAWEADRPQGMPSLDMKVIVGRAAGHATPVFASAIRQVIFRPYWNVPRSIVRAEILPAIRKNADYLRTHNMEIVRGESDDAIPVASTAENLERLREGQLRLRQRPGPTNALGLVKFVFPNEADVYLHGTPAQELFGRARRDFSHGCVRVEDPVALAEWVLRDSGVWDRERIRLAMNGSATRVVGVQTPITVILFYTTAVFVPDTGGVEFADDIYGHDARLARALAVRHTE